MAPLLTASARPSGAPHRLILMGNFPFALRSVVWPGRLNNGVRHHGKLLDPGIRTANEEVQLGGDRVRSSGLDNIVHLMAIFAIKRRPVSDPRDHPTARITLKSAPAPKSLDHYSSDCSPEG